MFRNLIVVTALASFGATGCSDSVSAPQPMPEVSAIVASSPTAISGIVGREVQDLPAVTVQDAAGKGVAGIAVTFVVARGNGTLRGATAISDASGVARLQAWILGTWPEENLVYAKRGTLPAVVFHAAVKAGPVHQLIKVAGDNQVGLPGGPVPVRPQVKIGDVYQNAIAGVPVTIEVSGGGTTAAASAITDSLGMVAVDGWRLGMSGVQTVEVKVGEMAPAVFSARFNDPVIPCGVADPLTASEQRMSQMGATDCTTASGRLFHVFSVVIPTASRWEFFMLSTDFTTALELLDAAGNPVATAEGTSESKNTRVDVMLPAGTFSLAATSPAAGASGFYTIKSERGGGSVPCAPVFVTIGAVISTSMAYAVCPGSTVRNDKYRIYLKAGAAIALTLTDRSYSAPHLELRDASGTLVGSGVFAAYYVETLAFTAPAAGFYTISVTDPYDEAPMYDLLVK